MTNSNFAVPMENRYFEDYVTGSVHELGSIAVEEAEMIAFSKRYDPQGFHTDSEAAKIPSALTHAEKAQVLLVNISQDTYGFWRPYVQQMIYRYLDCGDLHNGFARVKCKVRGHEYLPTFFCKCTAFNR